jgi:death-on-curing protein
MTEFLELEDLLVVARYAMGAEPLVRDVGLLESALARPRATAFGQDAYPGLFLKAAALLHSLASNHALVDGNKRLAWLATYVLLGMNGQQVVTDQDSVVDLVVAVAAGELRDLEKIAARLLGWSRVP